MPVTTSVMDRLMGWDLAYSTTFAALNTAVAEHGSSPNDMSYDGTSEGLGRLSGSFGTWQLVADDNAVGKTVVLDIPFHVTSFEINGRRFSDRHYNYRADVVLAFSLHKTLPNGGKVKHLKTQGPDPETRLNESVAIRSDSNDAVELAIGNALEAWLKANIQTFTHVFSETLVMLTDANPVFNKLLPKAVSYAVKCPDDIAPAASSTEHKARDLKRCVFTVLCRLDDVATAGLTSQTDLSLVPDGCDGGIAISSGVLLEKLLSPLFLAALKPQNKPTFAMAGGQRPALINTSDVILPDFDLSEIDGFDAGATGVRPKLERGNLQFTLDGSELRVDFINLSFDSSDQLNNFTLNYTGRFTAELTPEGHLTLSDASTSQAQVSVSVTEFGEDYQLWANVAIQVVIAILCLIPGGEAAEGIDVSLEGSAIITEEVAAEVAEVSAQDAALADEEATAGLFETIGSRLPTSLKRFAPRFFKSLGKGMLVMLAIKAVGDLPSNLQFLRKRTANATPTMHDLAKTVMSANLWNRSAAGNVSCVSAEFDDGITLGLRFCKGEEPST